MAAILVASPRNNMNTDLSNFEVVGINDDCIILALGNKGFEKVYIAIDIKTVQLVYMDLEDSVTLSFRGDGRWRHKTKEKTESGNLEKAYFDIFFDIENTFEDIIKNIKLTDTLMRKCPKHSVILKYIQVRLCAILHVFETNNKKR